MKNIELAVKVINHILEHPETWDQTKWHCGTTHCFGGHLQIMAGLPLKSSKVVNDVRTTLDVSSSDAAWLTSQYRSLRELHSFVSSAVAGVPYFDVNGYDRAGYNRAGYNRDGYDRDGYNRAGYNRAGYNRAGYNRDGNRLPLLEFPSVEAVQ